MNTTAWSSATAVLTEGSVVADAIMLQEHKLGEQMTARQEQWARAWGLSANLTAAVTAQSADSGGVGILVPWHRGLSTFHREGGAVVVPGRASVWHYGG
eukprot:139879-Alexandrium_andersonii.AAC.2